jgi:exodeoxyribonuclease VII large subunit
VVDFATDVEHRHHRPPPSSSSRIGSRSLAWCPGACGPRCSVALLAPRADLEAERRAITPRATRPARDLRERVGLLLDRAARVDERLASAGRAERTLRLAPVLPARIAASAAGSTDGGPRARTVEVRLGTARSALAASAASLGSLAPQATLERGYAIVRRSGDGAILRDPTDAPVGTRLALTLAAGELPATSDGPAGTIGERAATTREEEHQP